MKLLIELSELKFSGAEIIICDYCSFLIEKGMTIHILSVGDNIGEFSDELRKKGCSIDHIPAADKYRFALKYYNYLRREKFDIVHLHLEYLNFWIAIIAKIAGVNHVVRSFHSCYPYQGVFRYVSIIRRWICRKILRVKDISVSEAVQENELLLLKNPSCLISNGVDTDKFRNIDKNEKDLLKKSMGFQKDCVIMIVVGTCNERKRHLDIIRLLKNLTDYLNDKQIHLLHFGTGPLLDKETSTAKELRIEDKISFMGNRTDIDKYFKISDIYLMPSYNEGLAIALLESMASGVANVVSNIKAFTQVIKNGTNGLVFDVDNSEEFEGAVRNLICDEDLRDHIGDEARKTVEEYYSREKMVNDLYGLYEDLYKGKKN